VGHRPPLTASAGGALQGVDDLPTVGLDGSIARLGVEHESYDLGLLRLGQAAGHRRAVFSNGRTPMRLSIRERYGLHHRGGVPVGVERGDPPLAIDREYVDPPECHVPTVPSSARPRPSDSRPAGDAEDLLLG
jgi:hypothetical protein